MVPKIIPSRMAGHSGMISIWSRVMPGISDDPLLASIKHNYNMFGKSSCTYLLLWSISPTNSLFLHRHGHCILENNNTLILIIINIQVHHKQPYVTIHAHHSKHTTNFRLMIFTETACFSSLDKHATEILKTTL